MRSMRHGSRSTSKGRLVASCPCGGHMVIKMVDHYNFVAVCDRDCGNMRDEHRLPNGISLFEMDKGRR